MALNEADTRAQLVDPKLKAAGWRDTQVTYKEVGRKGKQVELLGVGFRTTERLERLRPATPEEIEAFEGTIEGI